MADRVFTLLSEMTKSPELTESDGVGGYFGLELPATNRILYDSAVRCQSARAAFAVLLKALTPRAVWVPRYICDSMLTPLLRERVRIKFYSIDDNLGVSSDVVIEDDEWLLYVNYFGLCGGMEEALLRRFEPHQVVLDRSQAFFASPRDCLANVYSPRKFFGIPDGGLLISQLDIEPPEETDGGSVARSQHLLMRHDGPPAAGYAAFKRAEESLADAKPRGMSKLTARILGAVDFEAVRSRRDRNFRFLHERLGHLNQLAIDFEHPNGPLCYPLLLAESGMREKLLRKNIFVPTYWPEVMNRAAAVDFEAELVTKCLPIPCDQRYSESDLQGVVRILVAE